MTIDELEANFKPAAALPPGCTIHDAYWDNTCKKGTKGCGVYHKDVVDPPQKVEELKRRFANARERIRAREIMASQDKKCYHCGGDMNELQSVLTLPGIRYFVCASNAAHTVCIIPEDKDATTS